MTRGHRWTVAYAIVATSVLLGIGAGNRHLLRLEEARSEMHLRQAVRINIAVHIMVPYLVGGILTASVFLLAAKSNRERVRSRLRDLLRSESQR